MELVPRLLLNFTGNKNRDFGYIVLNAAASNNANNSDLHPFADLDYSRNMDFLDGFKMEGYINYTTTNPMLSNVSETTTTIHTPLVSIVLVSLLFCIVGIIGIVGNTSIILIIATDRKMRRSVTNLYISNLAVADLLVMLFGIPEIVQFIMNRGWILSQVMCKVDRCVLVFSLYSSVFTQVAVCVERYIAIVHPMKAHILCSRRRTILMITLMWPCTILMGLPVAIFNQLITPPLKPDIHFCSLRFPGTPMESLKYLVAFKYIEFSLFYLIPVVLQIVCYTITSMHLFAGTKTLHRKQITFRNGVQKQKASDTIKQRKGVVKMLIASVVIYFLSYSPHQVLLFYKTFSNTPFPETWIFLVFVTALGYVNSASNPILYCIFSQAFRLKFKKIFVLPWRRGKDNNGKNERVPLDSGDSCVDTMVSRTSNGKYLYTKVALHSEQGNLYKTIAESQT